MNSGSPARVAFSLAVAADAHAIAAMRTAAADELARKFGAGHWASPSTEKAVLNSMRHSRILIGRARSRVVATARLATKKPWAIDVSYFTPCKRAIYLTDMAVDPAYQNRGVGRHCIDEALALVRAWPASAIRLDAYDARAGAGNFYAKCGFTERGRVAYRGTPLVYYEFVLS